MKNNGIDSIFVGADRIAANGDTANKIGTYSLAVLANYHKKFHSMLQLLYQQLILNRTQETIFQSKKDLLKKLQG